jgi:hypothetical protein
MDYSGEDGWPLNAYSVVTHGGEADTILCPSQKRRSAAEVFEEKPAGSLWLFVVLFILDA